MKQKQINKKSSRVGIEHELKRINKESEEDGIVLKRNGYIPGIYKKLR